MPTSRHGKVRHLLNEGKAVVVRRTPFTIRLLYETPGRTQPVSLGVDAGAVHVGLSACTDRKELFSAECELRTDVNKNLEQRRRLRRSRRNRKTRCRKPRFLNRTHGHNKPEKKLMPSVKERCDCHVTLVRKVMQSLRQVAGRRKVPDLRKPCGSPDPSPPAAEGRRIKPPGQPDLRLREMSQGVPRRTDG